MRKEFTCIVCPVGCDITVDYTDKEIASIKGNTCPKGEEYVKGEIYSPKRVLTTSVRVKNSDLSLVSVRTSRPIPKEFLFRAMDIISECEVEAPVRIGDILIKNLLDTGADVIATKNVKNRRVLEHAQKSAVGRFPTYQKG